MTVNTNTRIARRAGLRVCVDEGNEFQLTRCEGFHFTRSRERDAKSAAGTGHTRKAAGTKWNLGDLPVPAVMENTMINRSQESWKKVTSGSVSDGMASSYESVKKLCRHLLAAFC